MLAPNGIMSYYNQLPARDQRLVKVIYENNATNSVIIGLSSGFATGVTVCPAVGGMIGGPTGAFVATLIGVVFGPLIGGAAGLIAGSISTTISIKADNSYRQWVELAKHESRYQAYKDYITAYFPNNQEFFCCISGDFPQIPVRSPNGHIYDQESIHAWLDQQEAHIAQGERRMRFNGVDPVLIANQRIYMQQTAICPFSGPYFTKNDLIYDRQFALLLRQKLTDYLATCQQQNPHAAMAMELLITSLKRTENMIVSRKVAILTQRMHSLNMSENQISAAIQRILND